MRLRVVADELQYPAAVEDDEDLLLGRVAMRDGRQRSGIALDVLHPRPARARSAREIAPSATAADVWLHIADVDDRRSTFRLGLGPFERRLTIPGMTLVDLRPARDRPHAAAAR